METQTTKKKTCPFCDTEFSSVSAKNRHVKNIHKHQQQDQDSVRKAHIICPLCKENKLICGTNKKLEDHLKISHKIKLDLITIHFSSKEDFKQWFAEQKIEIKYMMCRSNKYNEYTENSYICNRSNSTGYDSKYRKRKEKAGGSIKMYGVCPSRLNIKFYETGQIIVKFCKSHVGHEEEIRSQHLSKVEKTEIVDKLLRGVTVDRIISDARKVTSEKLVRVNILNRKDVWYLMKKHNLMQRKHQNSMTAVALKVNEWNANGKKYCSFLKQQGDVAQLLSGDKRSDIKKGHIEDIKNVIREKVSKSQCSMSADGKTKREMEIESLSTFLTSLNDETYNKCMEQVTLIMEQVNRSKIHERNMEKQEFFPSKKRKA